MELVMGNTIQVFWLTQDKTFKPLVADNMFLYFIIATQLPDHQPKVNAFKPLLQVCAKLTCPSQQTVPDF